MVEPVGPKPSTTSVQRLQPVAPSAPVAAPQTLGRGDAVRAADPSTLKALSASLTEAPPVDTERVAKIRKAVQDGHFPLLPTTVADRLLALKMQWVPGGEHEPS